MKDNLGLGPSGDVLYLKLRDDQDVLAEMSKLRMTLNIDSK